MTIDKFYILDKYKKIKYEEHNIKNMLHKEGEEYILNALFKDSQSIPVNGYYVGLDVRPTFDKNDTLSEIIGEPTVNGYRRQNVPLSNWSLQISNDVWFAKSGTIIFSAINDQGTDTGWGPVTNIFLATTNERCERMPGSCVGKLISSAKLGSSVSIGNKESVVMEMSLSLYDHRPPQTF